MISRADTAFMDEIQSFSVWLGVLGGATLALNYVFVCFFNIVSENVVNICFNPMT
jgi:hypothetical protein